MHGSAWYWALAATSIIALLGACGESETPPTSTPAAARRVAPDPSSPQDVLNASLFAMRAARSFHFALEATLDATVGGVGRRVHISFVGDYRTPDRTQGRLVVSIGESTLVLDVKTLAGVTFAGNSQTDQWTFARRLRAVLPNPRVLTTELAPALGSGVQISVERLGGLRVHRLQGVPSLGLFGELETDGPLCVWVGAEDLLVRRIETRGNVTLDELARLLERLGVSEVSSATVTMEFSAFGRLVEIEAPDMPTAAEAPIGPGERFPSQGNDHVRRGDLHPTYNSVPATSGWHYGQPLAPAPWGVHGVILPDEVLVHSLEHGGIGVHYDCPEGCGELVAQLARIVTEAVERGDKIIMTPYTGMGTRIALTAWTFLDGFDDLDEERIRKFIRVHESSPNAPEPLVR